VLTFTGWLSVHSVKTVDANIKTEFLPVVSNGNDKFRTSVKWKTTFF